MAIIKLFCLFELFDFRSLRFLHCVQVVGSQVLTIGILCSITLLGYASDLTDFKIEQAVRAVQERYQQVGKSFKVISIAGDVNGPLFPQDGYYDSLRNPQGEGTLKVASDQVFDALVSNVLANEYTTLTALNGRLVSEGLPRVSADAQFGNLSSRLTLARGTPGQFANAVKLAGGILSLYHHSVSIGQLHDNKMNSVVVVLNEENSGKFTLEDGFTLARSLWGTDSGTGSSFGRVWIPPPNFPEPMSLISYNEWYDPAHRVRVNAYAISAKYISDKYVNARGTGELFLQLYKHGGASSPVSGFLTTEDVRYTSVDFFNGGGPFISRELFGADFPEIGVGGSDVGFENLMYSLFRATDRFGWISTGNDCGRILFAHVFSFKWPNFVPPCPDPCVCSNPLSGKSGTGAVKGAITKGLSQVNNLQGQAFIHSAVDYGAANAAGCIPCGASGGSANGVPGLAIERFLNVTSGKDGSLGRGGFLGVDIRIEASPNSATVFLPHSGATVTFSGSVLNAAGSGFVDFISDDGLPIGVLSAYLNPNDATTKTTLGAAKMTQLRGFDGKTMDFELSPSINGKRLGRLTRIADDRGDVTTIGYRYAAADIPGDATGSGKWFAISSIKAPNGEMASVTTSPSPIGSGYPVTRIDLPNGTSLVFQYGPWATVFSQQLIGLKSIAHPDGSITSITGAALPNDNLQLTLVDPREESSHQVKTIAMRPWIPVNQVFSPQYDWGVWEVRNGNDEVMYRCKY